MRKSGVSPSELSGDLGSWECGIALDEPGHRAPAGRRTTCLRGGLRKESMDAWLAVRTWAHAPVKVPRRCHSDNEVALVGPSGGGKTCILSRLLCYEYGEDVALQYALPPKLPECGFAMSWHLKSGGVPYVSQERKPEVLMHALHLCDQRTNRVDKGYHHSVKSIHDTGGRMEHYRSVVRVLATMDVAVIVVDSRWSEEKLRCEHAVWAKAQGVAHVVVVANFMEEEEWSEPPKERLRRVSIVMMKYMRELRLKWSLVAASARTEEGFLVGMYGCQPLVEAISPWRRKQPEPPSSFPLRMCIAHWWRIGGIGTVLGGRVLQGTMAPNDEVVISNDAGRFSRVLTIECYHSACTHVENDHRIGVCLRGGRPWLERIKGAVIGSRSHPPHPKRRFYALISVARQGPVIRRGYSSLLIVSTAQRSCVVEAVIGVTRSKSTKHKEEEESQTLHARGGDSAEVIISVPSSVCVEPSGRGCLELSRFMLMDHQRAVAVGVVREVEGEGLEWTCATHGLFPTPVRDAVMAFVRVNMLEGMGGVGPLPRELEHMICRAVANALTL